MPPPRAICACLALIQILLLAPLARLHAQTPDPPGTFDLDRDRQPVVLLDGQWRFHPGDDPDGKMGWADPNLDDSAWPLIRSDKTWREQGYKADNGFAWYRAKIHIPAGERPLSLDIPHIYDCYQLFADGHVIGTYGQLPPHHGTCMSHPRIFAFPAAPQAHTFTLAIRVWQWPYLADLSGGGLTSGIRIGESALLQQASFLRFHETTWNFVSSIVLTILEILAGLAALAFFALRREESEYLWFGVSLLFSAAYRCFRVYTGLHPFPLPERDIYGNFIQIISLISLVAFYYTLLKARREWLFWAAVCSIAANFLLLLCMLIPSNIERLSIAQWNELYTCLNIPLVIWTLALLTARAIQGMPDARLLLAPIFLQQLASMTGVGLAIAYQNGWYHGSGAWFYATSSWPFPFSFHNIADFLFLIAMLAILIYRFTRTSRQQDDHKREQEAARSVQQILIPEDIPAVPGFSIQCVYKPAGQVGGDFFQFLPTGSGSVLIAIGDVSGKGTPAAMMVSLIVGALRMAAESTTQPAELLDALNRRLLSRSNGGFTTCLILRADLDGTLILANAGHLSPYIDGIEIQLENGLPLGLSAVATYPEFTLHIPLNQQLTLITDGVVEARNKSGELLGFDRSADLSTQSAESIAQAAQDFGQDDDITVLTLTRLSLVPS